jgi:hypothetical protein
MVLLLGLDARRSSTLVILNAGGPESEQIDWLWLRQEPKITIFVH